jgi:glycogen debranching enzyme
MPHNALPTFDVREIPFSIRGAWLDISPVVGLHSHRDQLHLVTHQTGMHAVLRFVPLASGEPASLAWAATPSRLSWTGEHALIEAVFDGVDSVRVRGRGAGLRLEDAADALTPFTGTYLFRDPIDGSAVFTSYESGRRYRVTLLRGQLSITGSEALGESERAVTVEGGTAEADTAADGGGWEIAIEEFETARPPYRAATEFEQLAAANQRSFDEFADRIAPWRGEGFPASALAAYVLWSATVSPRGFLARESVLMSKHWMDKVWSWDHCFNALALAAGEPRMALDQFQTPFDHQDESGALPDSVTHSEVLYNFVKPPIHGWALTALRESMVIDGAELAQVYDRLARVTRFWLDFRRVPGHVLPHYQHGNDSGWDNATTFDVDRVIESPDLAAFLLVQLETLAGLADEVGNAEGPGWREEQSRIRQSLMDALWDGRAFVAVGAASGAVSKTGSLLNLLPILAAEQLPREVTERLAADIAAHLTDHGPATQLIDSPEYEDDGYWRGPIWAPSTVLIEDGLRRSGFADLADEISERFRRLCESSGFAENFDARSGAGLRDRAYTWTASAYLILARQAQARASSAQHAAQ